MAHKTPMAQKLNHRRDLDWPRSYLLIILLIALSALVGFYFHTRLPDPVLHDGIDAQGRAVFSEHNAREHMRHLSETIGYRLVGTEEEERTKRYLLDKIAEYQRAAEGNDKLKFDVWVQEASGSHRFDIMHHMVIKMYTNVTNIIVRLSCGPECDQNAVLLNSHFDTTIGSAGAADDGAGVAVMLEIIRILSLSKTPRKNSVIFLFNGAEESLQDASHGFITMHELKDSIRAVINLEACGTTGREVLFQANSLELINAYKTVPYPHGAAMANDIFRTGLILSDTDFRQFIDYGNLTGIDMALYQNSYLYHTYLDTVEHVEPGSMQHMGENSLQLVEHLTSVGNLTDTTPVTDVVFFDFFGVAFVVYPWYATCILHLVTFALATYLYIRVVLRTARTAPFRTFRDVLSAYGLCALGVILSTVAALLSPCLVSFTMVQVLGKSMTWYRREWLGLVLFGPAAVAGPLLVQYFLPGVSRRLRGLGDLEYANFVSLMYLSNVCMLLLTLPRIATSFIIWVYSATYTLVVLWMEVSGSVRNEPYIDIKGNMKWARKRMPLWAHAFSATITSLWFTIFGISLLMIFVPLTGRMGADTPVDYIAAVLCGLVVFAEMPSLSSFSVRFGRAALGRVLTLALAAQALVILGMGVWPGVWPYDRLHPKRVFIQHLKNITSGETYLHVAQPDRGPFFEHVLDGFESAFGVRAEYRHHAQNPSDWDSIYPFSEFLESYRLDTAPYIEARAEPHPGSSRVPRDLMLKELPDLRADNVTYDPVTRTRSLTILCHFPSYTWNVIAFDAHVVDWSINTPPYSRSHHYVIRHAGGHGYNSWRMDLTYKSERNEKLRFHFTALEREGFEKNEERPVRGVKVLGQVKEIVPEWVTGSYLGTLVGVWEL
ncbi:uncharacterized protein VTP21DRAFT_5602 [Calcarisporiella thermophila]|uniref:uncharacterized protein n=1 Tax=Calcarisporiella thermophila TaxID=911321 RepID=UPI003742E339